MEPQEPHFPRRDRGNTRAGYDLTGKLLDDLPVADYRSYVIERCKGLVKTGAPLAVRHHRLLGGQVHSYEALWLPLSDDGRHVTMPLAALIYNDER